MSVWRRWKQELGPDTDPDSFAYRPLHNRWHTVLKGGLNPESVGDVLTRIGARAQLDIRRRRPPQQRPRRRSHSLCQSDPEAIPSVSDAPTHV
ncbi:hypothetical protein [Streptomyces sp. NPDC047453]|uniref:hypothetical protein n=1 Tax=Streptomyces sp. NPDC047453 TaxID=3154812 RepID=UPI0033D925D2